MTSGTRRELLPYPNLDFLITPNIIYGRHGPTLTLHGPKIQGPTLFYLAQIQDPNYSKLFQTIYKI